MSSKNKAVGGKWRKFISYYKPFRKIFAADMFFAFVGAAITLVIPLIIRHITSEVIYRETGEAVRTIGILVCVMVVLVLIEAYSNYFIAYYGHMMGARMERNLRQEIFGHYQKLSFSFYDDQKVGQLMSRVTNDLFDITELFHHGPEDIVISVIKLLGSLAILLTVNWKLGLVAFAMLPIMVVYAGFFNIRMKKAFKANRARIADINAQLEDSLSGVRVVRSFTGEQLETEKFTESNDRFVESKKLSYRYMGLYHSGLGAFSTAITIVVIGVGAIFMLRGAISISDLLTFLLYINNFTDPVKKLINFTEQFQNGMSGYERFLEVMAVEPDIVDAPDAQELTDVRGSIEFRDVSFHYNGNNEQVLSDIDLSIPSGEYVALVGSSGAGKTTLCSLIPRFYEVSEGSIAVDGKDIRSVTMKSLRSAIGIVQQDVYLFAGSVMENIRYGKPDATDEEVIEAARNANAHDFIMELPDGYDTYIGQRGIKLSGGQKQRLSIARVFLKDPPILIFDEATSSLDNDSERVVQESLESLAANRTTIVIAHRLSTIRNADRIVVLTESGIAEEGTHSELLEREGVYASLYNMQFVGKKANQQN